MEQRLRLTYPSRQRGVVWWVVVIIVVAIIAVIALAAGIYVATKPSGTVVPAETRVCPGGNLDVRAWLRGAQQGSSYTIDTTATRRCELGQNCTCGSIQGSFGTPTTPCDSYGGNAGPVTATDVVTPNPGLVTEFTKPLSDLREGVWEVAVAVRAGVQPAATKSCCATVVSGQTSEVTFWCQSLGLPGPDGPHCPDCTQDTAPSGPRGQTPIP